MKKLILLFGIFALCSCSDDVTEINGYSEEELSMYLDSIMQEPETTFVYSKDTIIVTKKDTTVLNKKDTVVKVTKDTVVVIKHTKDSVFVYDTLYIIDTTKNTVINETIKDTIININGNELNGVVYKGVFYDTSHVYNIIYSNKNSIGINCLDNKLTVNENDLIILNDYADELFGDYVFAKELYSIEKNSNIVTPYGFEERTYYRWTTFTVKNGVGNYSYCSGYECSNIPANLIYICKYNLNDQ